MILARRVGDNVHRILPGAAWFEARRNARKRDKDRVIAREPNSVEILER